MQTVIWLCVICAWAASADELRNVFLLWRHGDRGPYTNTLKVASSEWELWPYGTGQLTPIGISQQYQLGTYLKSVYGGFIPTEYNYTHYHLRSSDYDRTLMSAQANVAAFFSSTSTPLNFPWRPIPVHTVKNSREALFANEPCPHLYHLTDADYQTPEAAAKFEQHKAAIATIKANLPNIDNRSLGHLHDEVVCLLSHKYKLPDWMLKDTSVLPALENIADYFWQASSASDEKLTLRVGVFLAEMFDHMNKLIRDGRVTVPIDGSTRELATNHIMAYSAHDTNVAPLMAAFGLAQPGMPQYTACVMMELHGPAFPAAKSAYQFRLLYKNSYHDPVATPMKFKQFCPDQELCPFEVVEAHLQKYFISTADYMYRCNRKSAGPSSSWLGTIISVFSVIALVILFGVALFYFRRRRNPDYTMINDANA